MHPAFKIIALLLIVMFPGCTHDAKESKPSASILVFSATQGFRHASIASGKTALLKIGSEKNWKVGITEDATTFTEENLKRYDAVVFLNTSGDVLNDDQQSAFQKYIQAGGGFVGIHSATDTEYGWPWYNHLVGAYFDRHPMPQTALFNVVDKNHPAVSFMPDTLRRLEEIYNFRSFRKDLVTVVITVDEQTYSGGTMGADHPIAWYHHYDGGKAFYTEWGHHEEAFTEPLFLQHLAGAITWALD